MFQRYALFPHLNVFQNIAFGLRVKNVPKAEILKRVAEMLELVNLRGFEKRNVARLSGGQQQRVAIARAIVGKPKILIFDEATSALDNITQRQVSEALDKMGCTRIVIAHRLSTIRHCDRIVVLDKGGIAEDGSYDELIKKGGIFAELVKRQRADV